MLGIYLCMPLWTWSYKVTKQDLLESSQYTKVFYDITQFSWSISVCWSDWLVQLDLAIWLDFSSLTWLPFELVVVHHRLMPKVLWYWHHRSCFFDWFIDWLIDQLLAGYKSLSSTAVLRLVMISCMVVVHWSPRNVFDDSQTL